MPRTKQFCEEEVLNKAMELFWEKGFHATSIQDLVCHLGINRASLYDTFGGKEELFKMAFQHYRETKGNVVCTLFEQEKSIKKGIRRLFDEAIVQARTDEAHKGCFAVNTATELIPGDEAIHKVLRENKRNMETLFVDYIKKGIESGEIDASKDPESIGLMLFTLYNGLQVITKIDHDPKKLELMIASGLSVLDL